MPPTHSSNRIWKRADELVLQWERASRLSGDLQSFVIQVLQDLNGLFDASSSIESVEHGVLTLIAHEGADLLRTSEFREPAISSNDFSPCATWLTDTEANGFGSSSTLHVRQPLHREIAITLTLHTDHQGNVPSDESARRQLIADLAKAALEIVSVVYLRHRLATSLSNSPSPDAESHKIAAIYGGATLSDSFQAIAKAWESHVAADRVSILQLKSHRSLLVSTGSGSSIDRRSRLAILLQALSDAAVKNDEEFQVVVGEGQPLNLASQAAIDRYLIESNSRRLDLQLIRNPSEAKSVVAIIVTEWFTATRLEPKPFFHNHIQQATLNAINRDPSLWSQLVTRFGDRELRTKVGLAMGIVTVGMLLLRFVNTDFSIPADGRVLPAVRNHVFAPANATVTRVAVRTGQEVKQGDLLLVMRSTAIEMREEQLRGELLNAKTQLSSLGAVRMGTRRGDNEKATNALSVSANEELLKTQISGFEKQLELVEVQKQELMVSSPIDGIVSRWDLDQSLAMRPVTQGQYLLDVYSPQGGWIVEIDIADKDIDYLLSNNETSPHVNCRLQSQPDRVLQARVLEIAGSAQVNPQGRSIIRLKCSLDDDTFIPDAIGATVWADVDCGQRSIGFVWFRGVIEWWERQAWY